MYEAIIGIDPGKNGAIALYDGAELTVWDMPVVEVLRNNKKKQEVDEDALAQILAKAPEGKSFAYVEKVGAMPGQGTSSMFSFGTSFGVVKGALAALYIPRLHVQPGAWKTALSLDNKDKNASRELASELFPEYAGLWVRAMDDGRAEAALIAYYGYEYDRA